MDVCFVGTCRARGRESAYGFFVPYLEAKILLGRSRCRWEGNIERVGKEVK